MQCIRSRPRFEPLDERFVLWVIGESVHSDLEHRVRQTLDNVACFQIILAVAVWSQPPRRDVVNVVTGHKGIIVGFSDLVAESSDICKSSAEDARADPA